MIREDRRWSCEAKSCAANGKISVAQVRATQVRQAMVTCVHRPRTDRTGRSRKNEEPRQINGDAGGNPVVVFTAKRRGNRRNGRRPGGKP